MSKSIDEMTLAEKEAKIQVLEQVVRNLSNQLGDVEDELDALKYSLISPEERKRIHDEKMKDPQYRATHLMLSNVEAAMFAPYSAETSKPVDYKGIAQQIFEGDKDED